MRIRILGLLPLMLPAVSVAFGGEAFDAAARTKVVAPFVDEQTIAVAHVDFTRVKVDPLVDFFVRHVPGARDEQAEIRAGMKQMQSGLLKAGAREMYVLFSLADVDIGEDPMPMVVVPMDDGADEKALAAHLADLPHEVKRPLGGVFFAGTPRMLARVEQGEPDVREDLAQAFEAAGDTAAQALLLPPKYVARVIEELSPRLPRDIGGDSSRVVTEGMIWVALGVDPPPETSLRLVIQSKDHQAAVALHEGWVNLCRVFSQKDDVRRTVPQIDKIVALLTPKVQGDRLLLTLDEKGGGFSALLDTVKPSLSRARQVARRNVSANNLKQLALAMHNYHDAHKSFLPAASHDAEGKPLLSWRVHLLPYLDKQLYDQFHLDEPWDSEHNRTLIEKMPRVFRCPASKLGGQGRTSYLVAVGKETVFPGREGLTLES